ncbi:MAG: ferritin family protein [Spirochaetes bacterium]|nr:ferritin family protein [Spirochaetota bacterium]
MEYSPKEIIDMAVELEKTGNFFYNECAEKFKKSEELKALFIFLAEEELEHKKIFSEMLSGIGGLTGNFTDEYFEYLSAVISGRIFRSADDVSAFINEIDDVTDAFHAAIQAEKDSILFYSEMKTLYSADADTLKILDTLIYAERTHLVKLTKMLENT